MLAHLPSLLLSLLLNTAASTTAAPIPRPQEGFGPINNLLAGNAKFQTSIETSNPGLLSLLTNSGQAPQVSRGTRWGTILWIELTSLPPSFSCPSSQ